MAALLYGGFECALWNWLVKRGFSSWVLLADMLIAVFLFVKIKPMLPAFFTSAQKAPVWARLAYGSLGPLYAMKFVWKKGKDKEEVISNLPLFRLSLFIPLSFLLALHLLPTQTMSQRWIHALSFVAAFGVLMSACFCAGACRFLFAQKAGAFLLSRLLLLFSFLGFFLYGFFGFQASENVLNLIVHRSPYLGSKLLFLRSLNDSDGDGFSAMFGGGDLNDEDAKINPRRGDLGIDLAETKDYPLAAKIKLNEGIPARRHNLVLISVQGLRWCDAEKNPREDPIPETRKRLTGAASLSCLNCRSYSSDPALSLRAMMTMNYESKSKKPEDKETWHHMMPEREFEKYLLIGEAFEEHAVPDNRNILDEALKSLDSHKQEQGSKNFFLWLHLPGPKGPANYSGDMKKIDGMICEFLDALDRHDFRKNTTVVLTSTNGISLGEHGPREPRHMLYDSQLKVPLLFDFRGPDKFAPKIQTLTMAVSTLDIGPTLCQFLGLRSRDIPDVFGRSFYLIIDKGEKISSVKERPLFSALPKHTVAVTYQDVKFIYHLAGNCYEMYNLQSDPGETMNLADFLLQPNHKDYDATRLRQSWIAKWLDDGLDSYLKN